MKGIAGILLAATPLAALILYFALAGQQQVRNDQVTHETKQVVDEAKFDLEFEKANREISGKPMTTEEIEAKQKAIDELSNQAKEVSKKSEQINAQSEADLKDLRSAMEDKK